MAAQACGSCGSPNRAGRKFCAECGSSLGVSCPSCGTANEPGERFCGECGASLDGAASPARSQDVVVERRLVSVLFADLVAFTPLSEDHDAEEVRELLSRYFELTAAVIGRYGGQVEKFIGDAVMAVWGTPVAQEDDAERAVRAALELVDAVGEFGREVGMPELAARAAVLTGEAAVNLGAAGQGMVAGDLVNAASRVQAAAEPGAVLVGESTRRATESAIAYADAGAHELKGKAEPMPLWRAQRVTAGRGGSFKADVLEPPFVGRDRELRLLKELFHASADEGKAHLVSVVGIAGIGKSRLAWELRKYLDGITQGVAWHSGRCLAYGEGVTYWALGEMLRMRAGIAEGEGQDEAQVKLDAVLELQVEDADERAWIRPRVGQLLSLETSDSLERSDLHAGWRLFFERIAERSAVVLVFEDMQWADAPLLEFVEHLLDASRNRPIFVLALARPELAERHPHWPSGVRNVSTLALEPLSAEAMGALLEGFVPGLPEHLVRQILERSEGVPLYAVETVRMLLDRGLLEPIGDGYRPTGEIEALEVPETLQALVAARLDGLPADERSLLQDASVLGKTFTRSALTALSGRPETELEPLLASLTRKEILSLDADPRSPERGHYGFLQDLLRQVAHDTLPRRERKSRHLAAAAFLEQEWLDVDQQEVVEIVASHYLAALELDPQAEDVAELRGRADATLVRAAERAAALGAPENAERYLEQALALAESPLRRAELHERAGEMALFAAKYGEARSHFEQAITDFESLALTHPAARVTARLGILTWHAEGDIERAVADMERAYTVLAGEEHDADLATLAVQLARALFFRGRVDEAMERNELALQIAEALELPDVFSHALNTKGVILYFSQGRRQEAKLLMRHAGEVALAHDLSDAVLRAGNNMAAFIEGDDRYREALAHCERQEELARRAGNRPQVLQMLIWQAGLTFALGDWERALEIGDQVQGEDGPEGHKQWSYASALPIFVHRGQLDEARARLAVQEASTDPNEVQSIVLFHASRALILLAEDAPADALAAAQEALNAMREYRSSTYFDDALGAALTAAFALGSEPAIDDALAIVEQLAPGQLTPDLRALGARFGARRAALHGDAVLADQGFRAAASIFREIERSFDLAVVLLEHAEWLAGEGRLEEAEPLAAEAREIFERLRATPYLERLQRLPVVATTAGSSTAV